MAPRRGWPENGKQFEDRALRIVGLSLLRESDREPKNASELKTREGELLQELEGSIGEERRRKGFQSSKLDRLLVESRALQISHRLREGNGIHTPTIYHILGVAGLLYGLDSYELKRISGAMHSLAANHRDDVTFSKDPSAIDGAIHHVPITHRNYPSEIDAILLKSLNPMTIRQLVERMGMELSDAERRRIDSSLQLLTTMGLVKKLPGISMNHVGAPHLVWVSREGRALLETYAFTMNGNPHYRNSSMEMLNQLLSGPKTRDSLCKIGKNGFGDEAGIYTNALIGDRGMRLQERDLVRIATFPKPGLQEWAVPAQHTKYELTPLGRVLWNKALSTGVLPNLLIRLLEEQSQNRRCRPRFIINHASLFPLGLSYFIRPCSMSADLTALYILSWPLSLG